jgi:hypothetical protein
MKSLLRVASVALLWAVLAGPASAQPKEKPLPEPLPMGVPYIYQPGNNYWYAPALPLYSPVPVVAVRPLVAVRPAVPVGLVAYAPVVYPYPFASSGPIYGRYAWDYTGAYSSGYGWYSTNLPHYPYSYQYPTITGRVWMGHGW